MENIGENKLTWRRIKAAELVWKDELTDEQIAAEVGISPSTLYNWKNLPEFIDYLERKSETAVKSAQRQAAKYTRDAVDRLIELTRPGGRAIGPYETNRKACRDILEIAGIKLTMTEHSGTLTIEIKRHNE